MIDVSRFARRAIVVVALGVAAALPASAHRDDDYGPPGPIVEHLHRMGFVDWRELKFKHGFWKVDDARRANGHIYDLKVEDGSFDLVRLEREKP